MIEQNIRFTRVVGRGMHFGRVGDEPSHIHIPRPSRLLRRDAVVAMVEVTPDDLREINATTAVVPPPVRPGSCGAWATPELVRGA